MAGLGTMFLRVSFQPFSEITAINSARPIPLLLVPGIWLLSKPLQQDLSESFVYSGFLHVETLWCGAGPQGCERNLDVGLYSTDIHVGLNMRDVTFQV